MPVSPVRYSLQEVACSPRALPLGTCEITKHRFGTKGSDEPFSKIRSIPRRSCIFRMRRRASFILPRQIEENDFARGMHLPFPIPSRSAASLRSRHFYIYNLECRYCHSTLAAIERRCARVYFVASSFYISYIGIWPFRGRKKREVAELRGYAICTSPRTGSNLLCFLLSSTGQLGNPREYFNFVGRRQYDDPNYPTEPAEQFRRILTIGATSNGVYGLKVFPFQYDAVAPTCAWTKLLPNLKFIWLQRCDVLGQALSYARAIQTGQIRSTVPATAQPAYDANLIRDRLIAAVKDQARWSLFFARTGIVPLPADYEDVIANPQAIVDQIADFVGLRQRAIIKPELIELKKQRDALTEEWRARFLREEGSRDVVDPL